MSNVKIIKNNVKEILASMKGDRLGRAVMAGGFIVEGAAKISMSATSHSGRMYGKHRASAPGETPAVDIGNLVNSINTELASTSDTEAWANVGTNVEYAEPLEMGTSKMAARPFLRPAFDNNLEQVKAVIKNEAKGNIEGAAG